MTKQTGVGANHPQLEKAMADIELTEAAAKGDVRSEEYVPRFTGMSNADYEKYLKRASYFNLTERTISAVVGALVRKPYTLDGEGMTIDNSYSLEDGLISIYTSLLITGRTGLLLDPTPEEPRRVVFYDSDDILNWDTNYVVLDASRWVNDPNDPFTKVKEERRLALTLTDGVYTAQYFVKSAGPMGAYVPQSEPVTPLFRGRTLDFIPFICFNPYGIEFTPVKPPMFNLATLNIQHFNTSLIIAYGSRFFALPKPWVAGSLAATNPDATAPSSVYLGQEDVLMLNSGSTVGYLEFGGSNGMQFLASERDKVEAQMVLLGSRMLTQKAGVESVEALNLRLATESASLTSMVKVVDAALNRILEWCTTYIDGRAGSISLNTDIAAHNLSPQQVDSLLKALEKGVVTVEQVLERLYAAEVVRPEDIQDA